jgi:aryl-alcohol dehydrogenase-like predicted oxidoreductase
MAQPTIAWVLQNDDVASAITGASRPDQVAAARVVGTPAVVTG